MPGPYFTPATFRFLADLAKHNERAWFQPRKSEYEAIVRDPALRFIVDAAPLVRKISPHLVADARPVGGSLMRIHRDVRFSKDKSPYKTNVGIGFWHEKATDENPGPGLYLHLSPTESFVGGGMWHPPPHAVARIRERIVEKPAEWKKVLAKVKVEDEDDALKKAPRGFDPEHPFLEDLKRKSFTAGSKLAKKDATSSDLPKRFAAQAAKVAPLCAFLAAANGLDW